MILQGGAYACVTLKGKLKFIDFMKYQAPGTSLRKCLKSEKIPEEKGYFPYEWLDSYDKLKATELPPPESFYSELNEENTLGENPEEINENYIALQNTWKEKNMQTMKDFLIWYNSMDVQPFVKAINNQQQFYWDLLQVDMLKQTIGIPGLSSYAFFKTATKFQGFQGIGLPDNEQFLIEEKCRKNITGGPSIILPG